MWREGSYGLPIACPIAREFHSAMCIFKHGVGYKEVNSKVVSLFYGYYPNKCLKRIGVGFSFRWYSYK